MGTFSALPHEQIVAYVRGESSREMHAQFHALAQENTAYQLLFEMIDRFKPRVRIRERPATTPLPETFAAVEEMLLRFFSGEANDDEAQQLIDGLVSSPHFYQRLLVKLTLIAPSQISEAIPETAHIEVRTDEEIFNQIMAGTAVEAETERERLGVRSTSTVLERLRNFVGAIWRTPRYAFAISLVIIGVLIVYTQAFKNDKLEEAYIFDDKVPYDYASGLRGTSQSFEERPEVYSFVSNFKLGMSDYVVRNYDGAIKIFKNIEPVARQLVRQLKPDDQDDAKLLRDYYFYLGVSHFALSRSRRTDLASDERKQHLKAAIEYLSRADSVALAQKLGEENGREPYFLGLSYKFDEQRDLALAQLRKIKSESKFYEQSVNLVQEWSEH